MKTTRNTVQATLIGLLSASLSLIACEPEVPRAALAAAIEQPESGIAPRALTALRVQVAPVLEDMVDSETQVSGIVRAFRRTAIAAEVSGRVVERRTEPGDRVRGWQEIVILDATRSTLAEEEAQANLRVRRVGLEEARAELERGEKLKVGHSISDRQLDALRFSAERADSAHELATVILRSAQRSVEDATIRAPFTGRIEEVDVQVGDFVTPGTPIARLVDLSQVRVHAGVTATEAATLAVGENARVSFEELGGTIRSGAIRNISSVADPTNGTYNVELWLDNDDGRLRDGMVAAVTFSPRPAQSGLVIPRAALVRRAGRLAVFVVHESTTGTRAQVREVRVGRRSGENVEILDGLEPGEHVVIDGLFALRDGARVMIDGKLTRDESDS
ncbi:efflux RND transporter periplasmic adaptor subunit [Myxococcota bacterium]|nr:efflux RND transporter periplasmic adaptor subunit [Myxococcota bacterium]